MGVFDNITPTPAAPAKGVFSAVTPAAKTSGGVFANVVAAPQKAPVVAPADTSPYFQGKEPTGTFIGISDQKDPFSGKPFLAYRLPGANATTTDTTRVAPANNPEVAAAQPKDAFQNPRMPESASHAMRVSEGATSDQQLDHRMAITLGGSNDPSNLKLISTKDNQAASSGEGAMTQQIADGKMSLFDAQLAEAKAKGLPTPFTDQPAQPGSLWDKLTKGASDLAGTAKELAANVGGEILKLGVGTQGQTNPEGLANLQALSAHLDPVLASLGKQGDALQQMKDELDATKLDNTNQASVDAYNQKINAFNQALQQYNLKSPEGQKLADSFNTALDAYNKSVIAPTGAYGHWSNFLNETVLQPYLTAVTAAGNASADVTENLSNPDGTMKPINKIDWGSATANELKLVSAGLGAVADPGMVPYQVANAVPVVGHVLDPLNWVFSAAGTVGGATANGFGLTTAIINKLPISKDDKTQLSSAIQDVGSTLGQFAVGAYLFGRAGKAIEMKGNPAANFKDLTLADAKELVDSTKKFALQVKARLPQNLQEAQRGFAKIPGIKDEVPAPEEDKKNTPPAEEIPAELKPLAEETGKFKTVEDMQTSLQNRKDALESVVKEGSTDVRVTNAIKELDTKIKAVTPEFFDKAKGGDKMNVPPLTRMAASLGVPRPPAGSALTDLALQQNSPHDFFLSLTDSERQRVLHTIDPDGRGLTEEEAAHAFYTSAKENIAPPDQALATQENGGTATTRSARSIPQVLSDTEAKNQARPLPRGSNPSGPLPPRSQSYDPVIEEHNGGVKPPENKGGLEAPEVDWSKGKEIAAIRQSTDTLERTLEKIFPKPEADKINEFLTEANRRNEAAKVKFVTEVRKETQQKVVKDLGIKPATSKSAMVQRLGEGRMTLEELKREAPKDWQNIQKASDFFRGKYDQLIDMWNKEREKAGLKPINKRPNYFRHFIDLTSFANMYGLDFKESGLPTAISGMTEYFRSQSPWTNAAMRRLGSTTTDDAVGGFDNYLDSAARSIFHTDTVQRGRLVDKYLRKSAEANAHAAQDIRDSGDKTKEIPPPVTLPRLANTLKQWTDTVSGKQNIFDRSLEAMVGRPVLGVMRAITRQFGLNVIGGNVGAAVTHAIPSVYTLATVDKGAAFHGLYGTLTSPFLEDFRKIDGVQSDFLTRRFGKEEIQPTLGEKTAAIISSPFHMVDQFISRWAVESKYHEGVAKGMTPADAMKAADNYASRVIGDRSAGNLPPIMSTKTLGWLTQFQIEVNDNLRVLLHDIPRWEEGSVPKIANRFVQFALYSYLFNQTMQYIKGSGKGLDPIDMGLTLAGLNDEGHDKTLQDRLGAVAGDLLKELPFTSVPTGGQIPALQPLVQAITDATTGSPIKALEGVLASFASPVGGGQQLQKSLTAIQAWRQGYVTDSKGNITATVPQTLPTLAQGVLFGKSAFDSVKKANTEIGNLDATLKEGQAASKLKNQQADNIWLQLKSMPKDQAEAQLQQIASQDPDMAKRVIASAKADALNMTKQDTLLKTLGVSNGARATYIANKIKGMSTDEEKKAYLSDLATKKILTSDVLKQVVDLLKK